MEIFIRLSFEASHQLPNVPKGHKCGRIHGHSYRVEVHVAGKLDQRLGWIMDFSDLKKICEPRIARLDHCNLNDIEGLENPTCENLARWLWQRLKPDIGNLSRIVVQETSNSGAIYCGEED
jgi:6-pyruvoyltetrahydropterin/6-carboxytetrahydropterin synthase